MIMMKPILLLSAHPDHRSFNHRLADRVQEYLLSRSLQVDWLDLYRVTFPLILQQSELYRKYSLDDNIQQICNRFESSSDIIVTYPEWWGMVPAVLKGWLDQVLRPGLAYDSDEYGDTHGLCQGRRLSVFCTAGESFPSRPHPMEQLWKTSIGQFCGFDQTRFFRYIIKPGSPGKTAVMGQILSELQKIYN